jgi:hypothetical protein
MNESNDDVLVETPNWSFDSPAVHREYLGEPGEDVAPDMARHPSDPFVVSVLDDGSDIRPRLFEAAGLYLNRIGPLAAFGLLGAQKAPDVLIDFGWLPLAWDDPQEERNQDARGSFWARRSINGEADRTAVLLASNRFQAGGRVFGIGGGVGLRVVLHVGAVQAGRSRVRITGFSTADLKHALLPAATRLSTGQTVAASAAGGPLLPSAPVAPVAPAAPIQFSIDNLRTLVTQKIKATFGFDDVPTVTGLRFDINTANLVRLFGSGVRSGLPKPRVYAYSASLGPANEGEPVSESLIEQISHAVEAMHLDPASQGPAASLPARRTTRSDELLNAFRKSTGMLPPAVDGQHVLDSAFAQVLPARVGSEPLPLQPVPHQVPEANPSLRSDDLSAIHAYMRAQELLQRFEAYGLPTDPYFKFVKLPLKLRYRAAFAYASDGETVNAQVSPDGPTQNLYDVFEKDKRPNLEVSFGAAELAHRSMLKNNAGQLRAQPLGVAADARWAWHEFGHVLNVASTGELEFRFAHSAGDALAAIVADPHSAIDTPDFMRHLTFPWVRLTRSHGRPAHLGWCWCGSRSRLRQRAATGAALPIPGGYWEEQLMSSSLFRLYCAIGGDTFSDADRRKGASDYVVFLIMKALQLQGTKEVVPTRSADQFVDAMIHADIGTNHWLVKPNWPEGSTARNVHRRGGAVHKVIRWAFQCQGLYATEKINEVVEGPGLPSKVDIYIPGKGPRATGGYEAVDLAWSDSTAAPWHADADSIQINGSGTVKIKVANCGAETAEAVSVQVWVSPADGTALNWQPLVAIGTAPKNIGGAGGVTTFAFLANDSTNSPLKAKHFVFAAATCFGDKANTDPSSAMPCGDPTAWTTQQLLIDLVANDNNLGLQIVDFS